MARRLRHAAHRPWLRIPCAVLVPVLLCLPVSASAHALLHQVRTADSVVLVEFHFPDGDKPFFEGYRVMGPDDQRPFQIGRINAAGEIAFRPDRPGPWRVIVAAEDGHGTELRIDVEAGSLSAIGGGGSGLSQSARLIAGVGYLLGIFGIIGLGRAARARRRSA